MPWLQRFSKAPYQPVAESEPLYEPSDEGTESQEKKGLSNLTSRHWPWYLHLILLLTSASFACIAIFRDPVPTQYGYKTPWSPMSNVISYKTVKFDLDPQDDSAFRGAVRPELDAAWGNVSASNLIQIDRAGMEALGADVNAFNFEGQYFAIVDVFHQLHCVEMIRRYMFKDQYPDFVPFQFDEDFIWNHVDHCFDMLRQKIMCDVDTGLIFYRANTDVVLDAEFNLVRQCRDFEPVQQWVFDHDLSPETYERLDRMARKAEEASRLAQQAEEHAPNAL